MDLILRLSLVLACVFLFSVSTVVLAVDESDEGVDSYAASRTGYQPPAYVPAKKSSVKAAVDADALDDEVDPYATSRTGYQPPAYVPAKKSGVKAAVDADALDDEVDPYAASRGSYRPPYTRALKLTNATKIATTAINEMLKRPATNRKESMQKSIQEITQILGEQEIAENFLRDLIERKLEKRPKEAKELLTLLGEVGKTSSEEESLKASSVAVDSSLSLSATEGSSRSSLRTESAVSPVSVAVEPATVPHTGLFATALNNVQKYYVNDGKGYKLLAGADLKEVNRLVANRLIFPLAIRSEQGHVGTKAKSSGLADAVLPLIGSKQYDLLIQSARQQPACRDLNDEKVISQIVQASGLQELLEMKEGPTNLKKAFDCFKAVRPAETKEQSCTIGGTEYLFNPKTEKILWPEGATVDSDAVKTKGDQKCYNQIHAANTKEQLCPVGDAFISVSEITDSLRQWMEAPKGTRDCLLDLVAPSLNGCSGVQLFTQEENLYDELFGLLQGQDSAPSYYKAVQENLAPDNFKRCIYNLLPPEKRCPHEAYADWFVIPGLEDAMNMSTQKAFLAQAKKGSSLLAMSKKSAIQKCLAELEGPAPQCAVEGSPQRIKLFAAGLSALAAKVPVPAAIGLTRPKAPLSSSKIAEKVDKVDKKSLERIIGKESAGGTKDYGVGQDVIKTRTNLFAAFQPGGRCTHPEVMLKQFNDCWKELNQSVKQEIARHNEIVTARCESKLKIIRLSRTDKALDQGWFRKNREADCKSAHGLQNVVESFERLAAQNEDVREQKEKWDEEATARVENRMSYISAMRESLQQVQDQYEDVPGHRYAARNFDQLMREMEESFRQTVDQGFMSR